MKQQVLLVAALVWLSVKMGAQTNCDCTENTRPDNLQLLMQSVNPACKAIGYEKAAKELFDRKSLDSAELFLQTALENYKKIPCSESKYLQVYKLFSRLYENKAEFQQSLEYSLKALPIAENAGLHTERADLLLNIAQVFNRLRQPDKAILYTRQSVPVVAKLTSSAAKAELLNKITARYFFYFQDVDDPTYADTAEVYVKEALIVAKEVNNTKEQIIALTRMNAIYESRKEYQKALGFIDEALVMCNPVEHKRQFTTLYGDKGYLLMKLNNFSEARRFADSCLFYCQEEKYPPLIANAYSLIFEIENKAGNYKEAVWALTNEKTITDSLSSTERSKAVNELEKKYNQARNEKTIKELAQQKEIYFLLAAAGLLGLIAIAFFLRQQSLKHKQRIMETEQRLNRARMNPHFFFNALASLQSFAVRENNGEAIAANLSKFSHIMRETLESTYKEYVTVEQEMDFLNEYLDVQKIRFPKKFSYSVTADKNVEVDETLIPAMIIQPFAENSIEHGFSNIDYPGLLNIHFSKNGKELRIEIKDNGKGLGSAAKESNEHISRASQIIRDRIYLLNIKLKTKASFSIDNIPPAADNVTTNGVIVKINLPLIYIESKSTI